MKLLQFQEIMLESTIATLHNLPLVGIHVYTCISTLPSHKKKEKKIRKEIVRCYKMKCVKTK